MNIPHPANTHDHSPTSRSTTAHDADGKPDNPYMAHDADRSPDGPYMAADTTVVQPHASTRPGADTPPLRASPRDSAQPQSTMTRMLTCSEKSPCDWPS